MTTIFAIKDLIVHASGHYLCTTLPYDYDKWSGAKLDRFLLDNIWDRLEGASASEIWSWIDADAFDLANFLREQGYEVDKGGTH